MERRQTIPRQWLIIADRLDGAAILLARQLPRGSGVLLLGTSKGSAIRQLRLIANRRDLAVATASEGAVRVHNIRELRKAMSRRAPLIFLSPLLATRSHPTWIPIPRMRAAALARLGGRQLIALGGMNERRYAMFARLGFVGWAGISAWSQRSSIRPRRRPGAFRG